MKLLSIGSVIRSNDIELIITGYHFAEEEKSFKLHYIVSLFPVGYISGQKKSQSYFAVDKEYDLVFEGYRDKYCEKYLSNIAERAESLKDMSPTLMYKIIAEANKFMEAKNNE